MIIMTMHSHRTKKPGQSASDVLSYSSFIVFLESRENQTSHDGVDDQ